MVSKSAPGNGDRHQFFERLKRGAVGLDVTYELATGERSRRIYLDSTASTLRLQVVEDVLQKYQPFYSTTAGQSPGHRRQPIGFSCV